MFLLRETIISIRRLLWIAAQIGFWRAVLTLLLAIEWLSKSLERVLGKVARVLPTGQLSPGHSASQPCRDGPSRKEPPAPKLMEDNDGAVQNHGWLSVSSTNGNSNIVRRAYARGVSNAENRPPLKPLPFWRPVHSVEVTISLPKPRTRRRSSRRKTQKSEQGSLLEKGMLGCGSGDDRVGSTKLLKADRVLLPVENK